MVITMSADFFFFLSWEKLNYNKIRILKEKTKKKKKKKQKQKTSKQNYDFP